MAFIILIAFTRLLIICRPFILKILYFLLNSFRLFVSRLLTMVQFHKHIFVDFSFELLNKCESRFSSFAPNLECEFIQHDIEKSNIMIPVSNERRKIILLLGNTLGNVESENSVLKNIYNSMNEDDLFLIGLTLWKENIDELEGYSNKIFRESVLEFLRTFLLSGYKVYRRRKNSLFSIKTI